MKTPLMILVRYGPRLILDERWVEIPDNWIVMMFDKVKKGDKYWNYNYHKFMRIPDNHSNRKVSHFGLVIRKKVSKRKLEKAA